MRHDRLGASPRVWVDPLILPAVVPAVARPRPGNGVSCFWIFRKVRPGHFWANQRRPPPLFVPWQESPIMHGVSNLIQQSAEHAEVLRLREATGRRFAHLRDRLEAMPESVFYAPTRSPARATAPVGAGASPLSPRNPPEYKRQYRLGLRPTKTYPPRLSAGGMKRQRLRRTMKRGSGEAPDRFKIQKARLRRHSVRSANRVPVRRGIVCLSRKTPD